MTCAPVQICSRYASPSARSRVFNGERWRACGFMPCTRSAEVYPLSMMLVHFQLMPSSLRQAVEADDGTCDDRRVPVDMGRRDQSNRTHHNANARVPCIPQRDTHRRGEERNGRGKESSTTLHCLYRVVRTFPISSWQ